MLASCQNQLTAHVQPDSAACHRLGSGLAFAIQAVHRNGDRQLCRQRVRNHGMQATLYTTCTAAPFWCHAVLHSCSGSFNTTAWKQLTKPASSCSKSAATCCGYAGHSSLAQGVSCSCSAITHHAYTSGWPAHKPCREGVCTGSSMTSRSVRVHGASLALAQPAAAAATATAVASSAAVSSSAFSFSQVIAVVLGYAVLAGSLFRSVPQIMKVLQHQSTEGLSLTSYIVELCCYSISIAYNLSQGYGFNTYGEVVACWAQDIILIALIFRFSRTKKRVAAAVAGAVVAGCAWLMSPCCPVTVLAALQASNIVTMAVGSRLPQIILNIRRGDAGVLSVMTCLLNVAGNAARIFTTVVLTGDMLLMAGYLSQGTLNTILLCQSIGTARQKRRAEANDSGRGADNQQQAATPSERDIGPTGPEIEPGGLVMQPAT